MTIFQKIESSESIEYIPPKFKNLGNLHLELLEVKKKLKSGLPLISSNDYTPEVVVEKKEDPGLLEYREGGYTPPSNKEVEIRIESSSSVSRRRSYSRKSEHSEEISFDDSDEALLDVLGDHSEPRKRPPERREQRDDRHHERSERSDDRSRSERHSEKEKSIEEKVEDYENTTEHYLWKLKVLKKNRPDLELPPYSEHTDFTTLKKIYDNGMREVALDTSAGYYKQILVATFYGVEFVATQLVGVDLSGFAGYQMSMINSYDSLLLELGERPYATFGSSLPVEARLFAMIVFQAGMFYLMKLAERKGNGNILSLMTSMLGIGGNKKTPPATFGGGGSEKPKKRRGPSIKVEDIKGMRD